MSDLFSITEVFRLWTSHIILKIPGFRIKAQEGSLLYNLLYPYRQNSNIGKNNKLIIIDNGQEKTVKINKNYKGFKVNFYGNNNTLIIDKSHKLVKTNFIFDCSDSVIKIGAGVNGKYRIALYGKNCSAAIGENTFSADTSIFLVDNSIEIGRDCMFSNNVRIITDPHSVLDYNTKEVLNLPAKPIKIGNHVWLGERTTLTKNAQIPDDCIVGIASVVTKSFKEEHCVIAGSPARIVKQNTSWDWAHPADYKEKFEKDNNEENLHILGA